MKTIIHAIASTIAMFIIAVFWISTLASELFMSQQAVASVKQAIVYGLFLLIPFLAATGSSGFLLGKMRKGALTEQKKKRMAIIAANGILIMVPAAIFLNSKAAAAEFDALFYGVQLLELGVGALQLSLMGMNFRDGLKLAGKLHPQLN